MERHSQRWLHHNLIIPCQHLCVTSLTDTTSRNCATNWDGKVSYITVKSRSPWTWHGKAGIRRSLDRIPSKICGGPRVFAWTEVPSCAWQASAACYSAVVWVGEIAHVWNWYEPTHVCVFTEKSCRSPCIQAIRWELIYGKRCEPGAKLFKPPSRSITRWQKTCALLLPS